MQILGTSIHLHGIKIHTLASRNSVLKPLHFTNGWNMCKYDYEFEFFFSLYFCKKSSFVLQGFEYATVSV